MPSRYGDREMVCVQASLLVEELVAAGYLLSLVGFIGGEGLGEASCHVGMPARACARGTVVMVSLRTAALQHVLPGKSKCRAIADLILTLCPHFNSSAQRL